MKQLPKWVIPHTRPAFYDTESATAIEQTARLYGAMRELIDETNEFEESTNVKIANINQNISGVQREISNLREADTIMGNQIIGINARVDGVTMDISGINTEINTLKEADINIDTQISDINGRMAGLSQNISGVQREISNLREADTIMGNQINEISQDMAIAKNDISNLKDADDAIRTSISDQETELKNYVDTKISEVQAERVILHKMGDYAMATEDGTLYSFAQFEADYNAKKPIYFVDNGWICNLSSFHKNNDGDILTIDFVGEYGNGSIKHVTWYYNSVISSYEVLVRSVTSVTTQGMDLNEQEQAQVRENISASSQEETDSNFDKVTNGYYPGEMNYTDNRYINSSGNLIEDAGYIVSDFIELPEGENRIRYIYGSPLPADYCLVAYNANKIRENYWQVTSGTSRDIYLNTNIRYVRATFRKSDIINNPGDIKIVFQEDSSPLYVPELVREIYGVKELTYKADDLKESILDFVEYRSEETFIGKWIDNKPIYRQVITITSGLAKDNPIAVTSSIDNFGKLMPTSSAVVTTTEGSTSASDITMYATSSGAVTVKQNFTSYPTQLDVVLEYTKNVDDTTAKLGAGKLGLMILGNT